MNTTTSKQLEAGRTEDTFDAETAALRDRAFAAASQIRYQFAAMKAELEAARNQIASLRSDTSRQRGIQREVNDVSVSALRRQVAFYLHPDRGGDAETMTRLNSLFDLIESLQSVPGLELAA